MAHKHHHVPLYLWPFWVIWLLLAFILKLTGRLVGAVLGVVFMIIGIITSLTIVGAVIGIPLIIFGFMLLLRSIF